jgi:hypothetical protein
LWGWKRSANALTLMTNGVPKSASIFSNMWLKLPGGGLEMLEPPILLTGPFCDSQNMVLWFWVRTSCSDHHLWWPPASFVYSAVVTVAVICACQSLEFCRILHKNVSVACVGLLGVHNRLLLRRGSLTAPILTPCLCILSSVCRNRLIWLSHLL